MSELQTIIFRKKDWTIPGAIDWLKENGYHGLDADVKDATYRFRQKEPILGAKYRSAVLPNGVTLVYRHVS